MTKRKTLKLPTKPPHAKPSWSDPSVVLGDGQASRVVPDLVFPSAIGAALRRAAEKPADPFAGRAPQDEAGTDRLMPAAAATEHQARPLDTGRTRVEELRWRHDLGLRPSDKLELRADGLLHLKGEP